jgi:hypothetical protein
MGKKRKKPITATKAKRSQRKVGAPKRSQRKVEAPTRVEEAVVPFDRITQELELAKEAEYANLLKQRDDLANEMTKAELAFCIHYLNGLTLTMAQSKSGLNGSHLFYTYPRVKQYINISRKLQGIRNDRVTEHIFSELLKIATVNIQDAYKDGEMMEVEELPRHIADAIQEVKTTYDPKTKTTSTTIKLYNKLQALDMLAKHVGFYNEHLVKDVDGEKKLLVKIVK